MNTAPLSFEQACELLGVTFSDEPREVKRAYLRQVKQHPPERDPEGFRRVRDAYELLDAPFYQSYRAARLRDEQDGATSRDEANDANQDAASETSPRATPSTDSQEDTPREGLTEEISAEERWSSELSELLERRLEGEEVEWEPLLATCPDPQRAWDIFYEYLLDEEELGARFLGVARDAGLPGFETALLQFYPARASAAEIEQVFEARTEPTGVLFHLALQTGKLTEASQLAWELLHDPAESVQARAILQLLFTLDSAGEFDRARALYDALVHRVEETQSENTTFAGLALDWYLVRGYFAARGQLSDEQKRLFGKALEPLDWEEAPRRLAELERGLSAASARSSANVIKRSAPHLHPILYPLDAEREEQEEADFRKKSSSGPMPRWILLGALIAVSRLVTLCSNEPRRDTTPTVTLPSKQASEITPKSPRYGAAEPALPPELHEELRLEEQHMLSLAAGDNEAQGALWTFYAASWRADCVPMQGAIRYLSPIVPPIPSGAGDGAQTADGEPTLTKRQVLLTTMKRRYETLCTLDEKEGDK